uniref:Uncharacterized protein n=1 Tax=Oryza sativa subsp. japonica TaxID=39947 RepID=Q6Z369_ORYSJ|nr:hypothetical protein [Oryza sativa Japonica Group]
MAAAPVGCAEGAPCVEQRGRLAVVKSGGTADEVGGSGWRVDDDDSGWGGAICTVDNGRRTPPPTEDGSASEEGGTQRCDDRGRQQRRGDGARRWGGENAGASAHGAHGRLRRRGPGERGGSASDGVGIGSDTRRAHARTAASWRRRRQSRADAGAGRVWRMR